MSKALPVIIGIILAAFLAYFCINQHIVTIPADIKYRTSQQLKAADLEAVGVSMNGRDVILSGIVDSDNDKADAQNITLAVNGVRKVDNQIIVAAANIIEDEFDEPDSEDKTEEISN